jgi:hypothetical protein
MVPTCTPGEKLVLADPLRQIIKAEYDISTTTDVVRTGLILSNVVAQREEFKKVKTEIGARSASEGALRRVLPHLPSWNQ